MSRTPMSAADPRPNGEPYYRDSACDVCGEGLVLYRERYPDAYDGPTWHDEWVCPNRYCESEGIYMDWPDEAIEELRERAQNADENAVPFDEAMERLGFDE